MDDKFKEVKYEEFEPDPAEQEVINNHVGNNPWLLISLFPSETCDLGLNLEAGGGMTVESIEPLLAKALTAIRQSVI